MSNKPGASPLTYRERLPEFECFSIPSARQAQFLRGWKQLNDEYLIDKQLLHHAV
jgi:hypothetical protein